MCFLIQCRKCDNVCSDFCDLLHTPMIIDMTCKTCQVDGEGYDWNARGKCKVKTLDENGYGIGRSGIYVWPDNVEEKTRENQVDAYRAEMYPTGGSLTYPWVYNDNTVVDLVESGDFVIIFVQERHDWSNSILSEVTTSYAIVSVEDLIANFMQWGVEDTMAWGKPM